MANTAANSAPTDVSLEKARVAFGIVWSAHEAAHGADMVHRERIRAILDRAIVTHVALGEDLPTLVRNGHDAIVQAGING
jgi:hypothetical protein